MFHYSLHKLTVLTCSIYFNHSFLWKTIKKMPNILSYTTASVVLTDIFSNPTHTVKLQNWFLVYSCGYKKLTLQRFKLLSFSLLNNRAEKCFLVSVLLVMSRSTDLDHSLSSSVTHLHLIQGLGNLREAEGLLHHGPDLIQSR